MVLGSLLPPGSRCLGMAAVLCFFAAAYSVRLFRFNQKAPLWRFWAIAVGIILFWALFYLPAYLVRQDTPRELSLSRFATAIFVGSLCFDGGDGLGEDYLCFESGFGCG